MAKDTRDLGSPALETDELEAVVADEASREASGSGGVVGVTPSVEDEATAAERVPIVRLSAVVAAPVIAAAVMTGGVFLGASPRIWAAIAGLAGVALGARASMIRRPALLYAAILGGVFAIGVVAVIPTGLDNVLGLGREMRRAIEAGDVLRPPVEFMPGWRAILTWLMGALGFASAWVAIELRKPALGLIASLPVVGIGAISVPESQQLASGLVALVLFVIGLGLLSSTQTSGEGDEQVSLAFEARRAIRALPLIAGVTVALYFAAQSNFLFPPPLYDPAQEAKKPKTIPLSEVEDRVLFTVEAGFTGPWKMGSLDVYDGQDWRLPPFAQSELAPVPADGVVDDSLEPGVAATFTIGGLGGAILPGLPNTYGIAAELSGGQLLSYDQRSGNIRLSQGQFEAGFTYRVVAAGIPQVEALQQTQGRVPRELEPFAEIDSPPPAVRSLLAEAPQDSQFAKMDYMRQTLLETVTASGSGSPVSVTDDTVEDLLAGSQEGTPFEIVAAQAMLARWAGVPSRIGYGFDGGDEAGANNLEVRPKHGAVWMEVWFEGYGWLPIIGDPLQAQESFSDSPQQFDPRVLSSTDVSVRLYLPVLREEPPSLTDEIRDLVLTLLPIIALLLLIYYLWPLPYKAYRRARRRTWANNTSHAAHIIVAYAEWRDLCTDYGYRHYTDTPLMFLERVVPDEEHAELAWLVTRALWGDLAREVGRDDAIAAEELSRSLRKRLSGAHAATLRAVAALSRLSLRNPYDPGLDLLVRGKGPEQRREARPEKTLEAKEEVHDRAPAGV